MWLQISTITALWLLLDVGKMSISSQTEDGLDLMFSERTQSDWENVWHQESHSRCRDKLVRHLYWACEKDIYRLTRRSSVPGDMIKKRSRIAPWIEKSYARNLLQTRRTKRAGNSGNSITAECCTRVGCTWEEYAEYCPSNKRKNHFRN